MSIIVIRIVIGLLLIIHGIAHWQITTTWGARPAATSWLLGGLGEASVRAIGQALSVAALVVFIAAGGAILINQAWWRPLAILASTISLLIIVAYWQPKMVLGALIDAGILAALLWANWPTPELSGV